MSIKISDVDLGDWISSVDKMIPYRDILEEAIEFVRAYYQPEDIFSEEQLADWAKEKGYRVMGE